jgi:MFS family permease
MSSARMSRDARLVLAAQAVRAFAYGFGAVLVGTTLARRGLSSMAIGGILASVVAGTVLASVAVARWADRWGRRRWYAGLYVALGGVGLAFAESGTIWLLVLVSLSGALSTEVVESGPFTSLEQTMLAGELAGRKRLRGFGAYNAVATLAGSVGALAAALPGLLRNVWPGAPSDPRWFWLFVPLAGLGFLLAHRLSPAVEANIVSTPDPKVEGHLVPAGLGTSRPTVVRLAGLFAVDSFGGGFVVQSFVAFWLTRRFDATTATVGVVFFAVGLLQAVSFLVASRLGERFGLLSTMVFTHLPSNLLLVALAFAPNLAVAIGLLLARVTLSQMDVPARQAYVMAMVGPSERTAAAAYTNTARYITRPAGPLLAGAASTVALGLPFAIAGTIKSGYDLILWAWFRHVPVTEEA